MMYAQMDTKLWLYSMQDSIYTRRTQKFFRMKNTITASNVY